MERPGDAERRLRDADLPTPFSAAEIRDATPAGHTVETLTEEFETLPVRHRTTFVECDATGATMRTVAIDDGGDEAGDPVVRRSTWIDLQSHASFPADVAVREREELDTALGRLDCLRYEVRRGEDRTTFWFALDHPGMPVQMVTVRTGDAASVTTVTAIRDL